MKTIRQMLNEKGNTVYSATPDMHVFEALELMAEKDIGALLVVKDEQLIGVFSERDYARKVILKGRSSRDVYVKDIMSSPPIIIRPDNTNEQALALMSAKHIRHLPVMEGDKLVGIVTIGDLVNTIIDEQKLVIDRLEKYILANTSLT